MEEAEGEGEGLSSEGGFGAGCWGVSRGEGEDSCGVALTRHIYKTEAGWDVRSERPSRGLACTAVTSGNY